ncbi:unnamed protein product [Paramecium octaurelia]|uniref:Uncharacterized protein n=1 Tax=Paramecium octaurelia TaxID=43137 RepID=A0A8S1TP31_PAROT|nr:unnamed protein product [Paramecium octaurelia]
MQDFQQTLDENQNLAEALQTQQNIKQIVQLREVTRRDFDVKSANTKK